MSRIIFHIDVNSAYLSWESAYRLQQGETLDLRKIPSAIGGNPRKRHGIILAKSTPAKKYNIKTGESIFEARLKCPNLHIVPPNYSLYMKCSNAMVEIFRDYFHKIERYSIDECFLDYSNSDKLFGDYTEVAERLRKRIKDELGFTVSIGISSNKLLAKMASDMKKPDAITTLFPDEIKKKMWPLPIGDLFMVGRASENKLRNMGIRTIGHLAESKPEHIRLVLKSHGEKIWNYANGIDGSEVKNDTRLEMKGIGNSTTISYDVTKKEEAHMFLLSLAETVGMRLRETDYLAGTISVAIKTSEFVKYSHQGKFDTPTNCTHDIYLYAKKLFNEAWKNEPIRHLGIRLGNLVSNQNVQLSLFEDENKKYKLLDETIDKIRLKYSKNSLVRACFLNTPVKPSSGGVGEEEYPMMKSFL